MANTLWVQARPGKDNASKEDNTRKVILSEFDPAHPGTHEVWIVAYEDPRVDSEGNRVEPANPPVEVGDTPLVRQRIADKDLIEVRAPAVEAKKPSGKPKPGDQPPPDPNAGTPTDPNAGQGAT